MKITVRTMHATVRNSPKIIARARRWGEQQALNVETVGKDHGIKRQGDIDLLVYLTSTERAVVEVHPGGTW